MWSEYCYTRRAVLRFAQRVVPVAQTKEQTTCRQPSLFPPQFLTRRFRCFPSPDSGTSITSPASTKRCRDSRRAQMRPCVHSTKRCSSSAASASPSSRRPCPAWTNCSRSCPTSPRSWRTSGSTSHCALTPMTRSSCRRCCCLANRVSAKLISPAASRSCSARVTVSCR